MKLKHILMSGLCLAAFAACTNDDFNDQVTVGNLKGVQNLGPVTVTLSLPGDAATRAEFGEDSKGDIKSFWNVGDKVGGALYAYYTGQDRAEGTANGAVLTNFLTNNPYTFAGTEKQATADFSTDNNVTAGWQVLYYPYDGVSDARNSIPVTIQTAQKMDVTQPFAHVSSEENYFAYTNKEFTKGGAQAGEFSLKPVPVLYRLTFQVGEGECEDLVGQKIAMIVIEANDGNSSSASSCLYKSGKIAYDSAKKYGEAKAAFEGEATVDAVTLEIADNDDPDYTLTAATSAGRNKKPFYLTTLPMPDSSTTPLQKMTISVVTEEGERYYREIDFTTGNYAALLAEVTSENGYFNHNITLDKKAETGDAVYTATQFLDNWKANMAIGAATNIELGAPITVDALELNGKKAADVTISGSTLTVTGDLNVTTGAADIENLVVEGATNVASSGKLNAGNGGSVNLNSLTIATAADVVLENVESCGNVSLEGNKTTLTISGAHNYEGAYPKSYVSGTVKVADGATLNVADINLAGNVTADGDIVITGTEDSNKKYTAANGQEYRCTNTLIQGNLTINAGGSLTATEAGNNIVYVYGTTSNYGVIDASNTNSLTFNNVINQKGAVIRSNIGTVTFDGTTSNAEGATITTKVGTTAASDYRDYYMVVTGTLTNNGTIEGCLTNTGTTNLNRDCIVNASIYNTEGTLNVLVQDPTEGAAAEAERSLKIYNAGTCEVKLASTTGTCTIAGLYNNGIMTLTSGHVVLSSAYKLAETTSGGETYYSLSVSATGDTAYANDGRLIIKSSADLSAKGVKLNDVWSSEGGLTIIADETSIVKDGLPSTKSYACYLSDLENFDVKDEELTATEDETGMDNIKLGGGAAENACLRVVIVDSDPKWSSTNGLPTGTSYMTLLMESDVTLDCDYGCGGLAADEWNTGILPFLEWAVNGERTLTVKNSHKVAGYFCKAYSGTTGVLKIAGDGIYYNCNTTTGLIQYVVNGSTATIETSNPFDEEGQDTETGE